MRAVDSSSYPPPFSPILLASILLRPAPTLLFEKFIGHILRRIEDLYPEVFDRLKPLGVCHFLIIPTDFHLNFLIRLDNGKPSIEVLKAQRGLPEAEATISGPLLSLIQLTEGRVDGDALFFSRALSVEGNTEAILSLRNAVDSADISLEAIWSEQIGVLQPTLHRILGKFIGLYKRAHDDLDLLQRSITATLPKKLQQLDEDLEAQEKQVKKLEKEITKLKASRRKHKMETELN